MPRDIDAIVGEAQTGPAPAPCVPRENPHDRKESPAAWQFFASREKRRMQACQKAHADRQGTDSSQ